MALDWGCSPLRRQGVDCYGEESDCPEPVLNPKPQMFGIFGLLGLPPIHGLRVFPFWQDWASEFMAFLPEILFYMVEIIPILHHTLRFFADVL